MGIVDFTNPDACEWYAGKLRALLDMGVDCFKTDFGERIPTDVVWSDGADPSGCTTTTAICTTRPSSNCCADTAASRRRWYSPDRNGRRAAFPVHWGGDCESTFVSMAESLRGGLSSAMSGFGFWSHDIGGFEDVRTRRCSSDGFPSACCAPTAGCTAATAIACLGFSMEESVEVLR